MVLVAVTARIAKGDCIAKRGKTESGKPRYRCNGSVRDLDVMVYTRHPNS